MTKVERKSLRKELQLIAADIIGVHSAHAVYKHSGMAIECGNGGIVSVIYEREEAVNEVISETSTSL